MTARSLVPALCVAAACASPPPAARYYQHDRVDSVVLVTVAGAAVGERAYRPFGAERGGAGAAPAYGFTDKPLDPTGLHDFGARAYDAALARWISPDPFSIEAPAQALGRLEAWSGPYTYVGNRPTTTVDPSGLAGINIAPGHYDDEIAMTKGEIPPAHVSMSMNHAAVANYKVEFRNGVVVGANGRKLAAGKPMAYVLRDDAMYVFRKGVLAHVDRLLDDYFTRGDSAFVPGHPTLAGGDAVNGWGDITGGGIMIVGDDGRIARLSDGSGHFAPTAYDTVGVIDWLAERGVDPNGYSFDAHHYDPNSPLRAGTRAETEQAYKTAAAFRRTVPGHIQGCGSCKTAAAGGLGAR